MSEILRVTGSLTINPGIGMHQLRQAEIQNLGLERPAARNDENVRGLDVAMNDALLVSGIEGVGNGNGQIQQCVEREGHAMACPYVIGGPAALARAERRSAHIMRQHLAQGFPFQQLHGNEGLAILLAHVVDRADVRVIESGSRARFALKAFQRRGVDCGRSCVGKLAEPIPNSG